VLGAKLDTDGGGAANVPAYFAGGESDADEDDAQGASLWIKQSSFLKLTPHAGDAAPSWDDVAPVAAFPFAGPLLPAPAGNHDADMEAEATGQQHEPVRETGLMCSALLRH
jgi:hypothetical protein